MPVEEQVRRNKLLQERLRRYDVNRWPTSSSGAMIAAQKTEAARRGRVRPAWSSDADQHIARQPDELYYWITMEPAPFATAPAWPARTRNC